MKRNFGIGADSPMKQDKTTPTYSGINIDPMSSYDYKNSPNIPKFRDMVSLEQQQAYADKVDKRRSDTKAIKEGGGGTYREYKKDMRDTLGKGNAMSRKDWREQNLQNVQGNQESSSGDGWDYTDNKTETSTKTKPNEFPAES